MGEGVDCFGNSWKEEEPSEHQVENIVNIYQTMNISVDKSVVKTKMYYFELVVKIIGLIVSLITIYSFAESKIDEHSASSLKSPDYSVHDLNNGNTDNNKAIEKI